MHLKNTNQIFKIWQKNNPQPKTELEFTNNFTFLVAVVLSAQSTDIGVNKATKNLFKIADTPQKILDLGEEKLKKYIATIGLFNNKAKNIITLSEQLIRLHNSEVPNDFESLKNLAGVGQKTANVVLGHAFGIPGITVDTHFGRLSRRFGWTQLEDPVKIEHEVGALFPKKNWVDLSQRVVWHGRRICHSRKPACGACPLQNICPSFGVGEIDTEKAKKLVKRDEDFR